MTIDFTPATLTNATQLAGAQSDARTVGLAIGGYVVAWESLAGSPTGRTVHFQRYDALGNPEGSVTQLPHGANLGAELMDIVVTADGSFTILTQVQMSSNPVDLRFAVHSFSGATGAANAAATILNLVALAPNGMSGAQLSPDASSSTAVVVTAKGVDVSFNQDLIRATVSTTGVVLQAPVVVVQNSAAVGSLIEVVAAPNGAEFIATATHLASSASAVALTVPQKDIITLVPGTMVLASGTASSPQASLMLLVGSGTALDAYNGGGAIVATNLGGATSAGAQTFAIELVDLGAGRILMVWVADGGDSVVAGGLIDGVYAQVYSMITGGPEGDPTLIRGFGVGSNDATLTQITISADQMADGRVSLGLSYLNGLGGPDVFNTILDPRDTGVVLASATVLAETFVGTFLNDSFTGVSTGDRIFGGLGIDTVTFGEATARNVDLQFPDAVTGNSFVLGGIENLTGNSGSDTLRGDAGTNILFGQSGDDILAGRDGNDSLGGGAGNDLLSGGKHTDTLAGDAGNDSLQGDGGNDILFGGADQDRLSGGGDDDMLNGGDASDRLTGDAGNDQLSGDAHDDTLMGGEGDDVLFGGAGADILRAEQGADQVYGGADNDLIFADIGVAWVDGGTGYDTLRLSCNLALGETGIIADLTGVYYQFGILAELVRVEGNISGIEHLTGDIGNDFLVGDAGPNILRGMLGNDTLVSGNGIDTLFGGDGSDVFVFTSTTGGIDQIRDISFGNDKIGLLEDVFGDINVTNIASRLVVNATATAAANAFAQVIFDNSGVGFGQLFFDADGNGAGVAVQIATLFPTAGTQIPIAASDFWFF